MADLNGFDARTVEPLKPLEPIPAGKYRAIITQSEQKPTKAGNGQYLQLTFEVQEGAYQGRRLWARLNLDNPNPEAVKIAQAELAAICRAVEVMAPSDSVELHNLPLVVHVKCKRRADTDEMVNEIKGFSPCPSVPPPTVGAGVAAGEPWKRS